MDQPHQNHGKSAAPAALFLLFAMTGVAGAAGVALAAYAAHRVQLPVIATAATMLMIHAAAALAICAIAGASTRPRAWIATGAFMLAAVSLFTGAVTYHALSGEHLFARAAPIGGSATIVSWLLVTVLAAAQYFRQR